MFFLMFVNINSVTFVFLLMSGPKHWCDWSPLCFFLLIISIFYNSDLLDLFYFGCLWMDVDHQICVLIVPVSVSKWL
jgi:hypothetical protein